MTQIAHSIHDMLSGMTPTLVAGAFVFATTTDDALAAQLAPQAVGMFMEAEGTSFIVPVALAASVGLDVSSPMHCITLNVYSSLEGIGLTAAVATALASNNISCNMVAAFHHDHVFVSADTSGEAIRVLQALQDSSASP